MKHTALTDKIMRNGRRLCKVALLRTLIILGGLVLSADTAAAKPIKHQITGLFMPERERDLREVVARIAEIKLISIDFKNAEANFEYDSAKFGKPEQAIARLDAMLKSASNHTFGAKPLCTTPREHLKLIEIPVVGLDCKACCLVAYEAVYKLEGVERATASFRERRVTAFVDARKTSRAALEAALKKSGVQITTP